MVAFIKEPEVLEEPGVLLSLFLQLKNITMPNRLIVNNIIFFLILNCFLDWNICNGYKDIYIIVYATIFPHVKSVTPTHVYI